MFVDEAPDFGAEMIVDFECKDTENFFNTGTVKKKSGWQGIKKVASRKLDMIEAASILSDLKVPPGNRLEALKGDLRGFHSIRINDQWRIIFKWIDNNAYNVKICDYH